MILLAALVLGSGVLWGATYVIDHFAFAEDAKEAVQHGR